MATFTLFDEFIFNLGAGNIDLDSHTFKIVLSNTAPTAATDDELADITQIANGNGYTTGGETLASVRVAPSFKLNRASAVAWAEAGFAKPASR